MKTRIEKLLSEFPRIMAKEIARKLGATKKEVNSCLYSYPGLFVNNNCRRTLLETKQLLVEIEADA